MKIEAAFLYKWGKYNTIHSAPCQTSILIDPLPYPEDQKYQQVDQYERGDWKIEPEVWPLDAYITRQVTQPFQVSAKEINENTRH